MPYKENELPYPATLWFITKNWGRQKMADFRQRRLWVNAWKPNLP